MFLHSSGIKSFRIHFIQTTFDTAVTFAIMIMTSVITAAGVNGKLEPSAVGHSPIWQGHED